jgi:hypothetical protein
VRDIENQMIEPNGYGIKDPQAEDYAGGVDACGDEIQSGDYILELFGEIILEKNAARYLMEFHG